jgi:glucose-1-phosphate thymidylyltransferase
MQAVILAAGEGTRVRPLTRGRPKALIPVANRPIIEYGIEALVKNGIREIIVVVGYRKEQVIRYLNDLDLPIQFAVQEKQIGTAHALQCAAHLIKDDFLLLPGDNYIDIDSIARIKQEKNALLVKEHPSPSNFGVVIARDGCLKEILEKPEVAPGFMVSTGIYSLTKEFLPYLRDETRITDAVSRMLAEGGEIKVIESVDWQDAIYPWDFLKMNRVLLKNITSQKKGDINRNALITGQVSIGKGTTIGPNTIITGPVVIGDDCSIGPNTCIMPWTSIGSRVQAEPFCYIGNSIIMDDTAIGSHSRIADTITGTGCILADHITMEVRERTIEVGGDQVRTKFGAVLGDAVRAKPFTVFQSCVVGNGVSIEKSHRILDETIFDNVTVM